MKNWEAKIFHFSPTYWGEHALFRLPVKAVHAVTMLSLKAIGL